VGPRPRRVRARDRILGFVASSRRIVVVARWKVWNCVALAAQCERGCSRLFAHQPGDFRILIILARAGRRPRDQRNYEGGCGCRFVDRFVISHRRLAREERTAETAATLLPAIPRPSRDRIMDRIPRRAARTRVRRYHALRLRGRGSSGL
jgi:hypothetical protein